MKVCQSAKVVRKLTTAEHGLVLLLNTAPQMVTHACTSVLQNLCRMSTHHTKSNIWLTLYISHRHKSDMPRGKLSLTVCFPGWQRRKTERTVSMCGSRLEEQKFNDTEISKQKAQCKYPPGEKRDAVNHQCCASVLQWKLSWLCRQVTWDTSRRWQWQLVCEVPLTSRELYQCSAPIRSVSVYKPDNRKYLNPKTLPEMIWPTDPV